VFAVQADEVGGADLTPADDRARCLLEEHDLLRATFPDRLHEPSARRKLLGERRWDIRVRRGDDDGVEGRSRREARTAVALLDVHVRPSGEMRLRRGSQIGTPLDAPDLAGELA
jgi:hypothetical protein